MNCSVVYCGGKGVKKCECGNIRKEFCQLHYDEHMKDKSISDHNPRLSITLKSSSEVILNYLLSIRSASAAYYKDFIESISKIHECIRIKSQNIIKEFLAFNFEIDTLIGNIKNGRYNISEGCLAECLKMPVQQALEKTKSWKLISNELNIEPLIKAVSEIRCLNNNLHLLYFQERSEETKKVADPVSRNSVKTNENAKNIENKPLRLPSPSPAPVSARPPNNKLYCRKNHQLVFDNLVLFKYWNKKKSLFITCELCNKKVTEATWNCQQCDSDVCCSCAKQLNQITPSLECRSGHKLVWQCDYDISVIKDFKCDSCNLKKSSISRWNCKQCNYSKCIYCARKSGFEPVLSMPRCSNKHILNQSHIIFNENNIKNCDKCDNTIVGDAFVCAPCDELYCVDCKVYLSSPLAAHPIAACGDGHLLIRHHQEYPCSYCKNSESIGYACIQCSYKICYKCCNYLIEIITKPIRKSIEGSELIWRPRCNEPSNIINLRCII